MQKSTPLEIGFGLAITFTVVLLAQGANLQNNFVEMGLEDQFRNPGGPDFNCTGKDGYFADRYRECRVFYRCLPDGRKFTFNCVLDDQFDDLVQTCVRNGTAYCPPYNPDE